MHTAYLLTGSNQGNRLEQLQKAKQAIEQYIGPVQKQSSIYETASWGNEELPPHLNQALAVNTSLKPEMLLDAIQKIEIQLGRIRQGKWGLRSIDIDIIFYDQIILSTPTLKIPHPYLQQRKFVLIPIAEIDNTVWHPILNQTITELLQRCSDPLAVNKLSLSVS